jgi:mannose-6-phosphate isomerase-like protein (cupin superfamily)
MSLIPNSRVGEQEILTQFLDTSSKMSTERRWDERRFQIEESTSSNGGKRTVFTETMTPGTSVPPHYHTRFSETFDLISGSMTVFKSDQPSISALENSATTLQIGAPQTVKPMLWHKYTVGDEVTRLRATITPGNLDFERVLKILDGLRRDGEVEKLGNDVVLMTIIMELTDAHLVGPAKGMLDEVYAKRGDEVQARKDELLGRYDTDEALRRLTGKM